MTTFSPYKDGDVIKVEVTSENRFDEAQFVENGIYVGVLMHPISDGNKIYIRAGHYIHIDKTLKGYQVSITKNQRVLNIIIL